MMSVVEQNVRKYEFSHTIWGLLAQFADRSAWDSHYKDSRGNMYTYTAHDEHVRTYRVHTHCRALSNEFNLLWC